MNSPQWILQNPTGFGLPGSPPGAQWGREDRRPLSRRQLRLRETPGRVAWRARAGGGDAAWELGAGDNERGGAAGGDGLLRAGWGWGRQPRAGERISSSVLAGERGAIRVFSSAFSL